MATPERIDDGIPHEREPWSPSRPPFSIGERLVPLTQCIGQDRREDYMPRITNKNRSTLAAVGCIDQLARFSCFVPKTSDWVRSRNQNRNQARVYHHISESNIQDTFSSHDRMLPRRIPLL